MSRKTKNKIFLLGIFVSFCHYTFGQDTLMLTMDKVIEMAHDNSFDAYSYQYTYSLSELSYLDQTQSTKPRLSFSSTLADYSRSIQDLWDSQDERYKPFPVQQLVNSGRLSFYQPLLFTGGALSMSSGLRRIETYGENPVTQKVESNFLNYISTPVSLSYSQDFSKPNQYRWNNRIGELRFQEATQQSIENREAVTAKAVSQFYELLIAQNQAAIARLNQLNADSLLWMAKEKKAIFAISKADYLNLELQSTNAQIELEKAQTTLENLRFSFNVFLGLPGETIPKCQLNEEISVVHVDKDLALIKAFANNPDQVTVQRKLLESERSLQEAKRQPYSVSLNANIGFNENDSNFRYAYIDYLNQPQQGVSLTVSIPIYDGGRNSRNVQRARMALEYQQREAHQNKAELEQKIMQQVSNYKITASQLKAYAKSDTLGYFVYQAAKQRFILGKASLTEMLNAEERRQSARLSYLRQIQNYWTQYYAIRQLCLYDFEHQTDLIPSNE